MKGLKAFRNVPLNLAEWGRWFRAQSIPEFSDNILTGTAQFIGLTPVAVTVSEENDYIVFIDGGINETFWVDNKRVSGFSINSSNATSTALVKWVLIR